MSNYSAADLKARQELSDQLRLTNYASDGYLLLQKLQSDQRTTLTKQIPNLDTRFSQNLAQARAKLGLYAVSVDHRGNDLDYNEYN